MDGQKKRFWVGASLPIVVKLTMDLLLAALIPLGIAIWLTSSKSSAALEGAAKQNITLLANVTATQLDQLLVDTARAVDMASRDDAIIAACLDTTTPIVKEQPAFDAVERRVHAAVDTNPDFASMFVTNRVGVGIASTSVKHIGMDFNFREYTREALAGHAFISQYTVGKTSGDAGVYISHPVFKRDSASTQSASPIGVVVIKLKGEAIDRLVSAVRVGELGYGILTDDHGVVLSSPHDGERFHSFATLSDSAIKEINPQLRYSLDTVKSIDMPELMSYISTATARGSAAFSRPLDDGSREPWVAGYSMLTERPWKIFVIQPTIQFQQATNTLLKQQGYVGLGLSVIALLMAIFRARSVTTPVIEITETAKKLASGDFKARAAQYSNDEVGQLAKTFNDMVPQLQNRVELQRTIDLAKQVQQNLLPQKAPSLHGLDIAGRSEYCDSTGGDYYDFVESIDLSDQQSLIAIGDVTGHGLGAALLMCTARAALRSSALGTSSLGVLMSRINTVLTQDAIDDMYMTLTLMIIDVEKATIRYACAAHDPIFVLEPGTTEFKELAEGSVPLGAVPGLDYEEYLVEGLKPGSLLFIGTDGIWEARNDAGDMFGKERMLEAVLKNADKSAKEIGLAVEQALYAYLDKIRIQDDVTYVVVKVI